MSDSVRVALVGYGLAGKIFHAPLITSTEGMTLTTVVSSDPDKVHADLPGVQVTGDLGTALESHAIDLVVLATPDALHAEQALSALDAGKHVVVDKPFAPSLAEARLVAERAADRGLTLAIFHNRRWDGDFLTVRRLVEEGALGEIMLFESHFDRFRPEVTDRWKDKRAGGVWQDLGPHLVDQALRLFGMPEALFADIGTQRSSALVPDYAHVVLRYGARRVILQASQMTHANGLRFAVHGTRGSYIKYGTDPQEGQSKAGLKPASPVWGIDDQPGLLTRLAPDGRAHEIIVESERGNYAAFYEALRDAILDGKPNPVPPQQALDVMTVIEAGRISADERREVRL
ncbi:oxidoreductase [Sphingomonas cavernae]|uniref:Oxidoreductase n=1 Tax=Sphingomonas cavernae TaxID=2320861 RepID=A0A418WMS6_9SPHN|nr:oxidoreductase [Sphingomonas cavernae]RJF91303.1 oxidoreductase [Sphingomonas cavernae]